jgi:hypothetical protein
MIAAEIQTEDMLNEELQERIDWCNKHFGPEAEFRDLVDESRPWLYLYSGHTRGFWWYFAREEYDTLFVLKWS